MSFFRSHASAPQSVTPQYTGLQLQTSSSSVPIPLVWGRNVVAPNLVWNADFSASPQYSTQSSGGKGGGGGNTSYVSGYLYQTALIFGLCEGPIASIGTVWQSNSTHGLSDLNLGLWAGTTPQSPWSYLTAVHPDQALGYGGLAYVASATFNLGDSASLQNHVFEVYGVLAGSGCDATGADPAQLVSDFLTNAQYGVGFSGASIDATSLFGSSGDASYQTYCWAAGFVLSPSQTDQEPANTVLARWLQLTNTAAVWSGGKLKFVPYGDASFSGNGRTFVPNTTAVYDLTDDDFVASDDEDPVAVTRSDPYAAYNVQRVEVRDRGNTYSATPVEARDQNAIELYGLRIGSTITAHEICDVAVGSLAAQLILQRGLYVRNSYAFKLSWEYCLLEPMDLVTVTDAALGLNRMAVRITEIDEGDDGLLSVTAEEFPGGVATATAYPVAGAASTSVDRNVTPAPVNAPIIFEPPSALTGGVAEVWAAVSGGHSGTADPYWGGAVVWASLDGSSYTQIGQVTAPAKQGLLGTILPAYAGANPDTADTLNINIAMSATTIEVASTTDAQGAITLCILGNELLAYGAVTLTGSNAYALTYLERGLYGSSPGMHAVGTAFARLDGAIFRYGLPDAYLGKTIYLKFQSFNIFGRGLQDLSTCLAYVYSPIGSGIFGPVATALSVGGNLDYGLAGTGINESDDFGLASDPYVITIDLGLASA